jgi:hypothetical protein
MLNVITLSVVLSDNRTVSIRSLKALGPTAMYSYCYGQYDI